MYNRPTAQYQIKLKFENELVCGLKASLNGAKEEELSEEQKKQYTLKECTHKVYPPFMPQCLMCLKKNTKLDMKAVDKKGREFNYYPSV